MAQPEKCRLCKLDKSGNAANSCDNLLCPSKVEVEVVEMSDEEFKQSDFFDHFSKKQEKPKEDPVLDYWGDHTNFSVL